MPFMQRSFVPVGLLVTVISTAATAQPTLPRERVPAMASNIRALVDRLYTPDPKERAEAACQLGRREEAAAAAIPVLLAMLADDVTVPAIECEMGPWFRRMPVTPEAQKWMETSPAKEAAEALGDIGNAAVPGLLQALAHSDWKVRKFAAIGLGEVDHIIELGSAINALSTHLTDANVEVRDRSAWALGEIEHPSAVNGLVAALTDRDASVREKVVWALGEIESDLAVDGLVPMLRDADANVRHRAAWALGEIESAAAVSALVQALADNDVELRRQSAWALGEIEDRGAVDGLTRALQDSDWRVRKTAAWALGEIEDPIAIDALRGVANDANVEVRRAVSQALRELGDHRRRYQ